MKLNLLLTSFFLTLNVFAIDYTKYDEALRNIQDPDLKKALIEKMSSEIAESLKEAKSHNIDTDVSSTESSSDAEMGPKIEREVATISTVTEESEKINVVKDGFTKVETFEERQDLKFNLGIVGVANKYKIDNININFIGSNLSVGLTKNILQHKLRGHLNYFKTKGDSADLDGSKYDLESMGLTIDFKGIGIGASYSYFFSDNVGLGGYINYSEGRLKGKKVDEYFSYDTSIVDFGVRLDFQVSAWNPYISVGPSFISADGDETYRGMSAYVGLINFEF